MPWARRASGTRKRTSAAKRKARAPVRGPDDAAAYLYVPCVRIRDRGCSAETRCWVQAVPIIKKTATRIYYTSDTWDRREAVVSPGCVSRDELEAGNRGYGPDGRVLFATRKAAEEELRLGRHERAGRLPSRAPLIKELRRAMADTHPDRGGTAEQFIQARRLYEAALRPA